MGNAVRGKVGQCTYVRRHAKTHQIFTAAMVDPAGQKYPAVHCPLQLDTDRPAALPKVPAGHAVGALDDATQNEPTVQVVGPLEPSGQKLPAVLHVKDLVGTRISEHDGALASRCTHHAVVVVPPVGQNDPAGHADTLKVHTQPR